MISNFTASGPSWWNFLVWGIYRDIIGCSDARWSQQKIAYNIVKG